VPGERFERALHVLKLADALLQLLRDSGGGGLATARAANIPAGLHKQRIISDPGFPAHRLSCKSISFVPSECSSSGACTKPMPQTFSIANVTKRCAT
jgi:hypothetical protein